MTRPAAGELSWVEANAQRVFLGAEDLNLSDTFERGDALSDRCLGVFVYAREWERGRAKGEVEDGLVGGVFSLRTSVARYTAQTALSDTGFIEVRAGSRGERETLVIDAAYVDARLADLAKNEDLSRYVL